MSSLVENVDNAILDTRMTGNTNGLRQKLEEAEQITLGNERGRLKDKKIKTKR